MQFAVPPVYRKSYVSVIMALNGVTALLGLALLGGVFFWAGTPGDYDVTLHVTFGALIATLGIFQVLLGWGDIWPEVLLFVFGLFAFLLPNWMHQTSNAPYATGHYVAGGVIMAFSVISALLTIVEVKKMRRGA